MSTPDWKRTASLGTAEAAAMREADERRRLARDPSPRRMAPVDEAQTTLILDLRERLARLEGAALGYRNLLQAGGGGGAGSHPFKILKVDAKHVSVVYGSVNGRAASNSGPGSSLTIGAQAQVWVKITWNTSTNAVTSAIVESGASVPANTDSVSYYGLGTVYFSGGAVVDPPGQGVTHSLSAERFKCGSNAAQFYYAGV